MQAAATFREQLKLAGLRPTRQREALARLLFNGPHRHLTAESLHIEARRAGISVSVATVYNTLNHFSGAGLLREVGVAGSKTHFDTDTRLHHHFVFEDGTIADIPNGSIGVQGLPKAPAGMKIAGIDIVVRLTKA